MHARAIYLKSLYLFLFLVFVSLSCFSQEHKNNGKGAHYNFEELEDRIWELYPDMEATRPFAKEYLNKAKLKNDSLLIVKGYDFLARLYEPRVNILYADSVIKFSKDLKHNAYPAIGYSLQGYWNYQLGHYKLALDAYLKAYNFDLTYGNVARQIESGNAVATLRSRWGEAEEALEIFRSQLKIIKAQPSYRSELKEDYLYNLYNTALAYQRSERYMLAQDLITKGLSESLILNDTASYHNFVFTSGINLYFLKEYQSGKDSLLKSKPYLDQVQIPIYHYHLAELENKLGNTHAYIKNLLSVDSLQDLSTDHFPELSLVYKELAEQYQAQGDTQKQLLYLNKLLKADSLSHLNQEYVNKTIAKRFDIPRLKAERDELTKQLSKQDRSKTITRFIAIVICIVLCGVALYQFFLKRQFQKRFDALIAANQQTTTIQPTETPVSENIQALDISKDIVDNVLKRLEDFEKEHRFIDKELTLNSLAADFATNSTYLSKIINVKKGKSFSKYLKELRIAYSIELLKADSKFRNYTIAAIADAVGFKSPESFSKAFYLNTGIYPSYFIKKLNSR